MNHTQKFTLGTVVFLVISTLIESLRDGNGITALSFEQGVYRVLFPLILGLLLGFVKGKKYNWNFAWTSYLLLWIAMTIISFVAQTL